MDKMNIGLAAGNVWQILSDRKTHTFKQLANETNLSPIDLSSAIGWLSRENKIEIFTKNGEEAFQLSYFEQFY